MEKLIKLLENNSYPGRGIVVGKNKVYYFIMGRSANSRNRIFSITEDGIKTEAFDPSKMEDASLIIYHPVRKTELGLIVTNGNQTDTIAEMGDFKKALMTREYEPDEPNFTPRISTLLYSDGSFEISILRKEGDTCVRDFYRYNGCGEDEGFFISTYERDGNPLPSFKGAPIEVKMADSDEIWKALNSENKISLYAYNDGEVKIYNKNLGD